MSTLLFLMTLLPVVFMLHDFEEIIMFRPWLRRNRDELKARFPRFEAFLTRRGLFDYSTSAFAVAVCHEFTLLSVASYGALYTGVYGWWFAAFMAFFLHLFVHVGQWVIYRKLLLSGKTQKDKIILLEALYNRTSGVHFQKASPP